MSTITLMHTSIMVGKKLNGAQNCIKKNKRERYYSLKRITYTIGNVRFPLERSDTAVTENREISIELFQ